MKQLTFKTTSWKHRDRHGGELRKLRAGRKMRALSTKDPIHLVLKANRETIRGGLRFYKRYFLIQKLVRIYSKKFFVKIEQVTIQGDHIHMLIRISKRSLCQSFLRVLSGQIAQQFMNQGLTTTQTKEMFVTDTLISGTSSVMTGTPFTAEKSGVTDSPKEPSTKRLWKYRPFTRVVKGWKAYRIVRDYISLNEAEALGIIAYSKKRLRALSEVQLLDLRACSA